MKQIVSFQSTHLQNGRPFIPDLKDGVFRPSEDKIPTPIDFQDGTCVIGGKHYRVQGIIQHIGRTQRSGHYVTFSKVGDQWILFDDTNIEQVDQERFFNEASQAYVISLQALT